MCASNRCARHCGNGRKAWGRRRTPGALECALDAHGFRSDPAEALESMVEAETETLILHELGEHAAGVSLSPAWERMLDGFVERRAELFARAVRDHLADCTVTLPALVARGASASIHFWFAGLDGTARASSSRGACRIRPLARRRWWRCARRRRGGRRHALAACLRRCARARQSRAEATPNTPLPRWPRPMRRGSSVPTLAVGVTSAPLLAAMGRSCPACGRPAG